MKTNQIMIRNDDRFIQRTKDGYFNANILLESWNLNSKKKPIQLGNYKVSTSTIAFIKQLKKEGIDKPLISSRGRNAATWMHPKLFIDFAMYVSVEFKSKVIDYVLDGLIKSRHNAGDFYNGMCATILNVYVEYYHKKPPALIYIEEANRIKSLVTDKPRNEMTEYELRQITHLQRVNSYWINKRIGKKLRIKKLIEAVEIGI